MIIHTRLFQRELAVIEKMKAGGYPVAETIRQLIRDFGKNEFPEAPLYAKVAAERLAIKKKIIEEGEKMKNMTPEEYATTVLLGKITVDGKQVEFRDEYGQPVFYNLIGIKEVNPDEDFIVYRHINFIKRIHVFANGQSPTEERYEEIFKGW